MPSTEGGGGGVEQVRLTYRSACIHTCTHQQYSALYIADALLTSYCTHPSPLDLKAGKLVPHFESLPSGLGDRAPLAPGQVNQVDPAHLAVLLPLKDLQVGGGGGEGGEDCL